MKRKTKRILSVFFCLLLSLLLADESLAQAKKVLRLPHLHLQQLKCRLKSLRDYEKEKSSRLKL